MAESASCHQDLIQGRIKPLFTAMLAAVTPAALTLAVLMLTGCSGSPPNATGSDQRAPRAVKGTLDLSEWSFAQDGNAKLNGEWDFYWQRFWTPEELKSAEPGHPAQLEIPGMWNGLEIDGQEIPGEGFATLQLRVKLPPSDAHVMALKINDIHTAYRIWIDDLELAPVGSVGVDRARTSPKFQSRILFFPSRTEVSLTLQVANHSLSKGGFPTEILLGTADQITAERRNKIHLELFLVGALLIMALYHVGLASLRKDGPSAILFGSFCFIISIRTLFTGERLAFNIFPSWELSYKLDILGFFVAAPIFFCFIYTTYPDRFSRLVMKISLALGFLCSAVVLLTPARLYIHLLAFYQAATLGFGAYLLYILVRAALEKKEGAIWVVSGFLVVFAAVINDILMGNQIIQTAYLTPLGVFFMVLSQSYLLAIRFSKSFNTAERLAVDLLSVNQQLKVEVAQRETAENAAKENEHRIQQFLEALPVGVFVLNAEGSPYYANQSAIETLGTGLESDIARDQLSETYAVYQAGSDELYPAAKLPAVKALAGLASYVDDMEIHHPEGIVPIEAWGAPVTDQHGRVIYALAAFQNIKRRKKNEATLRNYQEKLEELVQQRTDQLQQTNELLEEAIERAEAASVAKSRFLATMSHEIRTPLNGVLGAAELMERTELSSTQELFIETMMLSGHHLLHLINNILDFSRLEAEKVQLSQEPFALEACVAGAVRILEDTATEKGIQLHVSIAPEIQYQVVGDVGRLKQVLINLIGNAVKFTHEGTVTVSVTSLSEEKIEQHSAAEILFTVRDTGIGISEDQIASLFTEFVQVDSSETRSYGGTGLGLAISQKLVQLMGGQIEVRSEQGKGTELFFTLQMSTQPRPEGAGYAPGELDLEAADPAEGSARLAEHLPLKILVAEDNQVNQMIAEAMFNELGYKVAVAENGQVAIDKLSSIPFDIIFMDAHMPIMDGVTATKYIQKHVPLKDQPVIIAMTADALPGDREKYLSLGMHDYIPKPISIAVLRAMLQKWGPERFGFQDKDSLSYHDKSPEGKDD